MKNKNNFLTNQKEERKIKTKSKESKNLFIKFYFILKKKTNKKFKIFLKVWNYLFRGLGPSAKSRALNLYFERTPNCHWLGVWEAVSPCLLFLINATCRLVRPWTSQKIKFAKVPFIRRKYIFFGIKYFSNLALWIWLSNPSEFS